MRKHDKIRLKSRDTSLFLSVGDSLSRESAIGEVCRLLEDTGVHAQALYLIELFNLDAEELSEAGVCYEMLKALQRRSCNWV